MLGSRRHTVALLLFAPVLAALASSCSLALGLGEEQCQTNADCDKRGFKNAQCSQHVCVAATGSGSSSSSTGTGGAGGSDPAWSCLPGFVSPVPSGTVQVDFQIVMATGAALPTDLKVKLCSSFDASCSSPVDANVILDADGKHSFMVPPAFGNGYLEITSASGETYPTLAFFGTDVIIPPALKVIRLTTPAQLNALLNLTMLTADPAHGIAIMLTSDCQDQRTAGVALVSVSGSDAKTVPFYFNGNLPDPNATQTDAEGAGGFLNLKPGVVKVQASRFATSEYIGDTTFQVRPQTISYVPIGPTTKL
jgi:hypothetical protein